MAARMLCSLHHSEEEEEEFEGFTEDDVNAVSQVAANLASTNFELDSSSESESDPESGESDASDPMSPGH